MRSRGVHGMVSRGRPWGRRVAGGSAAAAKCGDGNQPVDPRAVLALRGI